MSTTAQFFTDLPDELDGVMTTEHVHATADKRGMFSDAIAARQYIRAGKATITIRSKKTDTRFTYKISPSDDGQVLFVGVLTGPDNENSYQYLGIIKRDLFFRTAKSRIAEDAPSHVAFKWTWRRLAAGLMPDSVEVWHEGRCGRCGRKLTVPESVENGFGPECITKVH